MKIGAKKARPIRAKVRNMTASSISPTNPKSLSGSKSTGNSKQINPMMMTLKKCKLLIKSIQNRGSPIYRQALRSTYGNSCSLLISGLLSSNLALYYFIFPQIMALVAAGSSSLLNPLNMVVIAFLQSGHANFSLVLSYMLNMHSLQNECPHVPDTSNFFGSSKHIEHCPSLNTGFLLTGSAPALSYPNTQTYAFLSLSLYAYAVSPTTTAAGIKTKKTYDPIAYIIKVYQTIIELYQQEQFSQYINKNNLFMRLKYSYYYTYADLICQILTLKKFVQKLKKSNQYVHTAIKKFQKEPRQKIIYKSKMRHFVRLSLARIKSIVIYNFFKILMNSSAPLFVSSSELLLKHFISFDHKCNFLLSLLQFPFQ